LTIAPLPQNQPAGQVLYCGGGLGKFRRARASPPGRARSTLAALAASHTRPPPLCRPGLWSRSPRSLPAGPGNQRFLPCPPPPAPPGLSAAQPGPPGSCSARPRAAAARCPPAGARSAPAPRWRSPGRTPPTRQSRGPSRTPRPARWPSHPGQAWPPRRPCVAGTADQRVEFGGLEPGRCSSEPGVCAPRRQMRGQGLRDFPHRGEHRFQLAGDAPTARPGLNLGKVQPVASPYGVIEGLAS
jgi:hypothetical protein